MRTSLKQLCEAAKKRNDWFLESDTMIRNSRHECPIVAGYIVLKGIEADDSWAEWNADAASYANEIGLTVDAGEVMCAADDLSEETQNPKSAKALRTRMLRYLGIK